MTNAGGGCLVNTEEHGSKSETAGGAAY
jgi:hypothetical protein